MKLIKPRPLQFGDTLGVIADESNPRRGSFAKRAKTIPPRPSNGPSSLRELTRVSSPA
jgi:hypothetical protein